MTGYLTPAVCGPYLRTLRLPGISPTMQCRASKDCQEGEECLVRPQGTQCISPQQYMQEEFAIGS